MSFKETQLTFDESGHSIHNYQVFSPDDKWIVYNVRNHDSLITSTESIRMVNNVSAKIKELYTTFNQLAYGPVVVAKVIEKPKPGIDEIEKAFDEYWIGEN